MAEEHSAKEAKFVALQEKKAEEAKEVAAIAKEEAAIVKEEPKQPIKSTDEKKDLKAASKAKDSKADSKPSEKKGEAKKEETKKDEDRPEVKKREIILERIYSVPLVEAYAKPQMLRGNRAIKLLRWFLARHMKTDEEKVKIALELNNLIRARGSGRPMKKVKVKATKDKEGIVLGELAA
ncbi:MAG: 50S ribosomal protein L31e [Candidatus Micrarchaeota archaeon]